MEAMEYIKNKQKKWAEKNGIKLVGSKVKRGELLYTDDLNNNLHLSLSFETIKEFENGDGNEINSKPYQKAKMCALHSSSAICNNIFEYWRQKDPKHIPDIANGLKLCNPANKESQKIKFEQKFEINPNYRISPNIDVIIENNSKSKIKAFAVECKFSEPYNSYKKGKLSSRYKSDIEKLFGTNSQLYNLADKIIKFPEMYKYLDAAQLIRHILGLKNRYGKSGFRLLYLWYDVPYMEGCNHRREIEEFADIIRKDNIKFHYMSYQELIIRLKNKFYAGNEDYIDWLTDRYL